jgi:hypothetical protein
LDDKARVPEEKDLVEVLGRSKNLWDQLKAHVEREYEPLTEKWSFSGKQYGWSLGLKRKKRTVLYLIPCARHFLVAFVLGEKAVKAARDSDLPAPVLKMINSARVYVEGRGVRFEVRKKADLAAIEKLAAIKMSN